MAIGATHAAASVNALAPELELGMLGFVNLRTGFAVLEIVKRRAIGKLVIVVGLFDLFDLQPIVPGKEERFLRPAVILDMALPAHKAAHFLPARIDIGIVCFSCDRQLANVRCWADEER